MDKAVLFVNAIAMVASVISAYVAVKAKNDTKEMITTFNSTIEQNQSDDKNLNINQGNNDGVMAQKIEGGVSIGGKKHD